MYAGKGLTTLAFHVPSLEEGGGGYITRTRYYLLATRALP